MPEGYSIDQFLRVQFFKINAVNGVRSTEWLDTIRCDELYKDVESPVIHSEFDGWNYICANKEEITLLNQPFLYQQKNGSAFFMTVSSCQVAEKVKNEFNVSTYNDTFNCVDKQSLLYHNTISQLFVQSKIMTRDSSNPVRWDENNTA